MNDNNLGNYIREKRQEKDITLRKLAEISGLSFSHLSKIERGEHQPSKETLEVLSEALEIDKNDLTVMAGYLAEFELDFWRDIYIKNNVGNTNPFERENVSDSDVIKFRNRVVHGGSPDVKWIKEDKESIEPKSKTKVDFSEVIDDYKIMEYDSELKEWKSAIEYFIAKGFTPTEVKEIVESSKNHNNTISEMAFDVIIAQSNMFSTFAQYHHLKELEGENSFTTQNAHHNYLETQGHYNILLYKYMIEFFKLPNNNPFQDRLLKKKFPVEYQTQKDAFSGLHISLKCNDGHVINNVAYYTGGSGHDTELSEKKARKYIEEHLKHFKQIK